MHAIDPFESKLAAIVCGDIALDGRAIAYAERAEPIDDTDSGWQFSCGLRGQENEERAQIWSVAEVIAYEPSLASFINHPIGTSLKRHGERDSWQTLQ
jgi:hypothetical protein